jgi:hypothetical protein
MTTRAASAAPLADSPPKGVRKNGEIFALGRHLLFRELITGHWIVIIAVIAILLLFRFWSPLVNRLERWWRSR